MMSKFKGFNEPKQNWSKLPHQLIDALPEIETIGEMKVIIYTLRHTWGYHDDYKKITLTEFESGRKRKDGSNIDNGTGLTRPTIIDGIKRAVAHGFMFEHIDTSDQARVKKFYSLTEEGLKDFTPEVKRFYPRGKEVLPRSEKETIEKETIGMPPSGESDFSDLFGNPSPDEKEPQNGQAKLLTEDEIAHLQTFGVMPDTDPEVYAIRQEIGKANWSIYGLEIEMAICYFVLAVRKQKPGFAIPNDDGSRKQWHKSVKGHLQNYRLADLQRLYKEAIIIMESRELSYWSPGSLTNWALPEVANNGNTTPSQEIDISKGFYV